MLVMLPILEYCKGKTGKTSNTDSSNTKPKGKEIAKHVSKRRKPPVTMAMVTNRGWYQHTKNKKIHFFDNRGYTPSLEYMKDKNQFDVFVKHLEP